jgi:apolipoprotein N-acyltransferase
MGIPNRLLHAFPAALVGLAPLFWLCWHLGLKQQFRWSAAVWLAVCTLIFLPDPISVPALTTAEIVGGIVVAPLVPLYFIAATLLSLHLSRPCPDWLRPLAIATIWTGFDSSFGLLQLPFPLHFGAGLYDFPLGIQVADVTGIWGVTFLTILANATLAALACTPQHQRWRVAGAGIALWSLSLLYGGIRLPIYAHFAESASSYRVGTIQQVAWLADDRSWTYREQHYRAMQELTQQAIAEGADLVVWPEGALRAQVAGTELERYAIFPLLPLLPEGGGLLTGSSEPAPASADLPWDRRQYINAALLYDSEGAIRDRYGKQWLFQYFETGRYVPYAGGYRPLQGGERLGPLGVTICLESVMPRPSRALVRSGAESLLVISDDSWFGNSNWPALHAALSTFRAVETRRSFAFVNNTGGNLIVAPSGQIVEQGEIWQRSAISGPMLRRQELTPATQWGDWFAGMTVAVTVGLAAISTRR